MLNEKQYSKTVFIAKKCYNLKNTFSKSAQMGSFVKLNQLNIRALRYYVEVCHQKNFSLIARKENVSASMISRTIAQLEEALGTSLLYRNTRSVTPTEAGLIFLDTAEKILATLDSSVQELHDHTQEVQGLVRISAPLSFTRHHIMPYLAGLKSQYPKLQLELNQSDSYVDPHKQGADLIFRIGSLTDSTLHARIVSNVDYALFAAPDYVQRYGTPNSLADLDEHESVVFKGHLGVEPWFIQQNNQWQRITLPIAFAVNDGDSLLTAAESGIGIAMLPNWLAKHSVKQGKLLPILTQYSWFARPEPIHIAMIYPNVQKPPRNVRAVMDYFIAQYESNL